MPPLEDGSPAPAAPATGDSFLDLATAAVAEPPAAPAADEGQAAPAPVAPAAEPAAPATPAEPVAAAEGAEAPAAAPESESDVEKMTRLMAEAEGDIMKLDPEKVPEELQGFLKSLQGDYTRKTQALAEAKAKVGQEGDQPNAEIEQLKAELEQTKAQIEAFTGGQTPAEPAPIDEALLYQGLGPVISIDAALAADTNEPFAAYVGQQAVVGARRVMTEIVPGILSLVEQMMDQRDQAHEQSQRTTELTQFFTDNPDLKAHTAKVVGLMNAGVPRDEAAEMIRSHVNRPGEVASAFALGQNTVKAQAEVAAENGAAFTTPSSATPPGPGATVDAEMSWEQIAAEGAKQAGVAKA